MVCSSCKKNKGMQENRACGYIPENKRDVNRTWTIPEISDLSINSKVCPVYTYLENIEVYRYVNQASKMLLNEQTFNGRHVIEVYENYQAMRELTKNKAKTSKNVNSNTGVSK